MLQAQSAPGSKPAPSIPGQAEPRGFFMSRLTIGLAIMRCPPERHAAAAEISVADLALIPLG